jgi:mxaJ protein
MRRWLVLASCLALAGCAQERVLTVCADPNNLPFSNRRGEGFENKIAAILARGMGAKLRYVWWSQRRGSARNTLGEGRCDAWLGVASGIETMLTTRPYYRSTYVFVTRAADPLEGLTLDDPRLRRLRLGVQLAGNDAAVTPPAAALARRGIVENTRGYMLTADYRQPDPPLRVLDDLAAGQIDVALAWGPPAGWFAAQQGRNLRVEPVTPWLDGGRWPMVFDVSVGVARDNRSLQQELQQLLTRNRGTIKKVIEAYHVPLVA